MNSSGSLAICRGRWMGENGARKDSPLLGGRARDLLLPLRWAGSLLLNSDPIFLMPRKALTVVECVSPLSRPIPSVLPAQSLS